ncbi:MAG: YgfB and YecA protein, partial [Moraxella osloensis]|nr:YgfB and YecA protein [Moraxella osloensis]
EEDDWFDDDDSEEDVAMLTLPMILFSGIDEDQPDMQELLKDPETMSQMAGAIEKNIVELFLLFHTND